MTDNEFVLAHLQKWGSITPQEALSRYGIMRLGARIWDLRAEGMDIETVRRTKKNRLGHPTTYAVYVLRRAG